MAKKKKKDKNRFELTQERLAALSNLKCQCQALERANFELLKKIEDKGLDGYYSVNSDILRYAVNIWKECIRLAEFKKIAKEVKTI